MKTVEYTSWKDGDFYLGFLNEYPDYLTQGETKQELQENLLDLFKDFETQEIPFVRKVETLQVA
ncbi:hypothetical protein CWO84_01000 [Methylomonas sp. Kb3]|uniref:hypothetical protein n=1 Tax=Methylomonas sp. Kb3 TaxID=1611544 RepID=UPI000C341C55|nr:hypothetical protein [Methylomonas sp. Kb3]PKD42015.1 hypothetical protein CWO84_01000 [Methylomonas sp. Kb3]